MAGSYFGDARGELEFEASMAFRKLSSLISSFSTFEVLLWANTYYHDSLKDENDCDFQLFILCFLNHFVRSSSYTPRRNGIVTGKCSQMLLESFRKYYEIVFRIRNMYQSLDETSVHISAVVHSDDINAFSDYYKKELQPFDDLICSSLGCSSVEIVDSFALLARNSLDRSQPLRRSSLMIRPPMKLPRLFRELAAARLSSGPQLTSSAFNWAIPTFPLKPVLKLDGADYCFGAQVVFPYLLRMVKSIVCSLDEDSRLQWQAVEILAEAQKHIGQMPPAEDNVSDAFEPVPEEAVEEDAISVEDPAAGDFPESDEGLPAEEVPAEEDAPEEGPDETGEMTEEDPEIWQESVSAPVLPERPAVIRSRLDDGLDEDPEDYPDDEPVDFEEEPEESEPEESEPEEYADEPEPEWEGEGEDFEVPESIQPSLFKDIVIENGEETIVESSLAHVQEETVNNFSLLDEAVKAEAEKAAADKVQAEMETEPGNAEARTADAVDTPPAEIVPEPVAAAEVPAPVLSPVPLTLDENAPSIGSKVLQKVVSVCGTSIVLSSYFKNLEAGVKEDLEHTLEEAITANSLDGKDKMFSIKASGLTFCVVDSRQDALSRMEMENNIAAVMLVNEKTSWNAVVIKSADREKIFDVQLVPVNKEQFPLRRWKAVQQLGWKLYMQMKAQEKPEDLK